MVGIPAVATNAFELSSKEWSYRGLQCPLYGAAHGGAQEPTPGSMALFGWKRLSKQQMRVGIYDKRNIHIGKTHV